MGPPGLLTRQELFQQPWREVGSRAVQRHVLAAASRAGERFRGGNTRARADTSAHLRVSDADGQRHALVSALDGVEPLPSGGAVSAGPSASPRRMQAHPDGRRGGRRCSQAVQRVRGHCDGLRWGLSTSQRCAQCCPRTRLGLPEGSDRGSNAALHRRQKPVTGGAASKLRSSRHAACQHRAAAFA